MDMEDNSFDWIEEYKKRENEYDKFYKSKQKKLAVYLFFIDKGSNINNIEALCIHLNDKGILSKDKLLRLIERGKQGKKYIFQKLLKYNVTVSPEEIDKLILDKIPSDEYFSHSTSIEDVYINDTIEKFHSLNNVILLFREKLRNYSSLNKTKRNRKNVFSKTRKIPTKNKHT